MSTTKVPKTQKAKVDQMADESDRKLAEIDAEMAALTAAREDLTPRKAPAPKRKQPPHQPVPSILAREPEPEPEPLLDLSTLAPARPLIKIDGHPYELAVMNDFGIEEQQQLTRYGSEFDRLWNTDDLEDQDRARLKLLLDDMFERVLRAPASVKKKCVDGQRSQVVLAFTLAPLAIAAAAAKRDQAEMAGSGSTTAS